VIGAPTGFDAEQGISGGGTVRLRGPEHLALVLSLLLCGWIDVTALVCLLLVTTSDFLICRRLASSSRTAERKLLLWTSVTVDIGLLLLWRTANWVPNLARLLGSVALSFPGRATLVPVGLSFFTLRSLGFVIDV